MTSFDLENPSSLEVEGPHIPSKTSSRHNEGIVPTTADKPLLPPCPEIFVTTVECAGRLDSIRDTCKTFSTRFSSSYPILPPTCERPLLSSLTSGSLHFSLGTTIGNPGIISHHSWTSKTFAPTTTCNLCGTLLLLDFTRILAHCRKHLSFISLSTTTKPPQASSNLLKNSSPHKCKGNHNALT